MFVAFIQTKMPKMPLVDHLLKLTTSAGSVGGQFREVLLYSGKTCISFVLFHQFGFHCTLISCL